MTKYQGNINVIKTRKSFQVSKKLNKLKSSKEILCTLKFKIKLDFHIIPTKLLRVLV